MIEWLTAAYLAVTTFYAWATFKIMQANQRTQLRYTIRRMRLSCRLEELALARA